MLFPLSLRACGARIASRTDELREEDVGTGAGLFEVKKIGDEYFTFVTECKDPKACTILLRGASKEILAVRDIRQGICMLVHSHCQSFGQRFPVLASIASKLLPGSKQNVGHGCQID